MILVTYLVRIAHQAHRVPIVAAIAAVRGIQIAGTEDHAAGSVHIRRVGRRRPVYNPQNEMFALFQTKRTFSQNETAS